MFMRISGLVAGLILIGSVAKAQEAPQFAAVCVSDIKALCSGVAPGEGRIASCLMQHVADLSQPCRERVARATIVARACADDRRKLCGDVEPGGGRVTACMRSKLSEVSADCRAALDQAMAAARAGHGPGMMETDAPRSEAVKITIDMGKITCSDAMHMRPGRIAFIASWISGWRHAKDNNTILDLGALDAGIEKVASYCEKNPGVTLLEATESVAKSN
jgi:hypothetical protein